MTTTLERQRYTGRLLAAVREEVAAHGRIAELLALQEAAVVAPGSDAFRAATEKLEGELARAPHRTAKREKTIADLGAHFGVAPGALTLTSLAERLGEAGGALAAERDRLQAAALETRRRTRRVNALVRMHREVTAELLQVVLGTDGEEDVRSGGTLIDAEV